MMQQKELAMYRSTRIVWYVLGLIEALLVLRFSLKLLGANIGADFTELVYTLSHLFLAPFQFVFGAPAVGDNVLEFSTLLAMLVYWMLAWAVVKLIVMQRPINPIEAHTGLSEQDNA